MVPVNLFWKRDRISKLERLPSSDGIVPVNSLLARKTEETRRGVPVSLEIPSQYVMGVLADQLVQRREFPSGCPALASSACTVQTESYRSTGLLAVWPHSVVDLGPVAPFQLTPIPSQCVKGALLRPVHRSGSRLDGCSCPASQGLLNLRDAGACRHGCPLSCSAVPEVASPSLRYSVGVGIADTPG